MRSPDLTAEHRAVTEADSAWAKASAAGEAERSLSFLADDAIMFPPGQPPVIGKAAIREFVRSSLAVPGFSVSWVSDVVRVATSGDIAYTFGRSRYTFPESTGALQTMHAKGVAIWRKERDGQWRCVADIWNEAPELPPISPPAART
jgi:uncharacterized protein (TIGR02246 family)